MVSEKHTVGLNELPCTPSNGLRALHLNRQQGLSGLGNFNGEILNMKYALVSILLFRLKLIGQTGQNSSSLLKKKRKEKDVRGLMTGK